jgi:AraC-like DNA-binding protein
VHDLSIRSVRALVGHVERRGVSRERLLASASLRAPLLGDDLARVSFEEFISLIRAARSLTSDPALGLQLGRFLNLGGFDVLGALAQQSVTVRQALASVDEYAKIVMHESCFELVDDGEKALIRLRLADVVMPEERFITEFAIAAVVCRWLPIFFDCSALTCQVHFAYRAPPYRDEYARVFGGRERFASGFSGVEFPSRLLDTESLQGSTDLSAMLRERADMLLSKLDRELPLSERVRRWLASPQPGRAPKMRDAARALGTSERSLRRHLELEGVAYSTLVDQARARHALKMLRSRDRTIQEISHALGFANPAAFTRAYKRWTGKPPTEDRARAE